MSLDASGSGIELEYIHSDTSGPLAAPTKADTSHYGSRSVPEPVRSSPTPNCHRTRPAFDTRLSDELTTSIPVPGPPAASETLENEPKLANVMSFRNPPMNRYRVVVCIVWTFICGFSDAAPGALLPHIETYYHVNYALASLIWISNALGFISVACFSHKIQPWLGRKYSLPFGCLLSCVMYAIVSSGTKFAATVVGFFFGGAGLAMVMAQTNIFLSRLEKQSKYLSFNHGSYGTGATVSPLIATGMVNAGVKWHFFYLVLLAMMAGAGVALYLVFQTADEDLKPWDSENSDEMAPPAQLAPLHTNEMILALKSPVTWLLSFFVLFYQGAEVSMAGWIVTFLLDYRHGNSSSVGYVASGFWAGLTIGRLVLTRPLHKSLGLRRSVIVVSMGSIVLVALIWAIPHTIADAVLVALAGILIGPNYPLLITFSARDGLIPRKLQIITLTIMTAFGSSGGALFPFIVGMLSQTSGTYVVMPVFIALYASMILLWVCLPNIERKRGGEMSLWERIW
ncbi:MFS general substrate transporter [Suhomyces tanzawaensis NRRL Y-17324]|uniref:MFS general substrate transporter n=1 Tax=Suhomyces tanzawaensis NRRL Y-17324 TaxID=984487 RepID=A0A1E4SSA5_9ASCO|nr:MFS general substrate transporter [Suhomyces tanzawaensis NRRL Y-17324]ODV82396.1 MFS general substrate transporter [Suhomyces tanzawaensis NRRL Y-17324]